MVGKRVIINEEEFRALHPTMSQEELARHYNCSVDTIVARSKKFGLVRTKEIRDQVRKNTNRKRYGGDSAFANPEKKQKQKDTLLRKYGVDNYFKSDEFKKNNRERNLELYGVENVRQKHIPEETLKILSSKEEIIKFLDGKKTTSEEMARRLGCSRYATYAALKKFDLWHLIDMKSSTGEREVRDFVESLGFTTLRDRKVLKRKEIDVLVPEKKIGFEYNGNYWHRESDFRPADYHQKKSFDALEEEIFLYHVFEYEWEDERKREAMKSQIRNLLGANSRRIGARKCEIREISAKEKNEFLNIAHVQGEDRSSVKLGLFFLDELVAVMTFKKPGKQTASGHQWELSRFACKPDVSVQGGASRLFKHFVKNWDPESIVTYSDIAKTKGGLYETLGFTQLRISRPNYVWMDLFGDVRTRYQCQMKNEREIMEANGYFRVYDCGNRVWSWKK